MPVLSLFLGNRPAIHAALEKQTAGTREASLAINHHERRHAPAAAGRIFILEKTRTAARRALGIADRHGGVVVVELLNFFCCRAIWTA